MNLDDIRDIKPPVYFASDLAWLYVILAIAILALLLTLGFRLWKKRGRFLRRPALPPKTADQIAYEALAALMAKHLPQSGKVKEYFYELSAIVRTYIENRFEIRAPEMTTEEFLFSLDYSERLTTQHKGLLKEFLTLCDIVKFAKYGPSPREIEESYQAAKRLVDETRVEAQAGEMAARR